MLDADVLDAAPKLRAVVHAAGSVKHHLSEDFWRRGIAASSAADANAYPVAQFTVSTIILAGKRALRAAHSYADGGFRENSASMQFGNHGRTVGVMARASSGVSVGSVSSTRKRSASSAPPGSAASCCRCWSPTASGCC
jgi:phosphoglycerate dehydrogenase-like enzyme